MIQKSAQDALDTLNEIVAEFGADYVYPDYQNGCHYMIDGEPSCLVGQVLYKWGVDISILDRDGVYRDESLYASYSNRVLLHYKDQGILELSPEAKNVLTEAQYNQDSGTTWGESVRRAAYYAD